MVITFYLHLNYLFYIFSRFSECYLITKIKEEYIHFYVVLDVLINSTIAYYSSSRFSSNPCLECLSLMSPHLDEVSVDIVIYLNWVSLHVLTVPFSLLFLLILFALKCWFLFTHLLDLIHSMSSIK